MDNGQDKEQSLDDLFPLDDSANLANDITIPNINIHTSNMVDDGNLDIGELHNDLSNEIVFTVWNNSKSGKTVVDSVKSSPCSPTISFLNETELAMPSQRQRSYSASMDKLNPQELAFLEELERGSQLTLEDEELIDLLSKKKFDTENLMLPESDSCRELVVSRKESAYDDALNGSSALKQLLLANTVRKQKLPKVIKVKMRNEQSNAERTTTFPQTSIAESNHLSTTEQVAVTSAPCNIAPAGDMLSTTTWNANLAEEQISSPTLPVYAVQFEMGQGDQPINLFLPQGVTIKDGNFLLYNYTCTFFFIAL